MADVNYWLGRWQRKTDESGWFWSAPDGTIGLLDFGSLPQCSQNIGDSRGMGLFVTPRGVSLPREYDLIAAGDCRDIQISSRHVNLIRGVLGVDVSAGTTLSEAISSIFAAGDPTGLSRWKPLIPKRNGMYEVVLGGHSTIYSRPFAGTSDPTWNKLRDLLRYDLDEHDKECKAEAKRLKDLAKELRQQGKDKEAGKIEEKAGSIEFHAEDVLDAMCRKYKCDPTELSTTIKRGDAHTTITENFDGSDGDTIGNLLTWTETNGDWDRVSNRAYAFSASDFIDARAESDLSADDHYAQCKAYGGASAPIAGICARFSASARTFYLHRPQVPATATDYISKFVAGSQTTLVSASKTTANGDVLKIDCSGSTITAYINAVQALQVTDSSITGNVRCGIWAYRVGGTAAYEVTIDDFEASDGLGGFAGVSCILGGGII